jgi:hypothetical protein
MRMSSCRCQAEWKMVRVLSVRMGVEEAGFSTSSANAPTSVEMTLFLIAEGEWSFVTMFWSFVTMFWSFVRMFWSFVTMFWWAGACALFASAGVGSCRDLVRVVRS